MSQPEKQALTIDPNLFDKETLRHMQPVVEAANQILWHWKTFPIVLPPPIESKIEPEHGTSSSMRKKTLNMRDLFVEPNFDEMKAIALNARGELRKLSYQQLESIRHTGEFEVDSLEFPGQKHRWILTQLLIKGKTKSHSTLLDDLANALYLMVVIARHCLIGKYFSVLQSLNGWSVGIMNLLDMFIGVPLMDTVGLEAKLQRERSRYLVAELKVPSNEEGNLEKLCAYLSKSSHDKDDKNEEEKLPIIPYHFTTPQCLDIDLRLANQEVMSSAKPYLLHILNTAMQGWIPEMRRQLISDLRATKSLSENDILEQTKAAITQEYLDKVCKLIYADSGISKLGPSIADLLVCQVRTAMVVSGIIDLERQKLAKHVESVEKNIGERHPIKSRIRPWLKRKLRAAHVAYVENNLWRGHMGAVATCKEAKLAQSAYFLSRDLSFRKDQEPMLMKGLKKVCVQPARTFKFATRIWMPKHWTVTEHVGNVSQVIPTVVDDDDPVKFDDHMCRRPNEEERTFSVTKKTYRTNTSSYPLWRWVNFLLRTSAWFWNVLFLFGIVIPWCSPLSLRALFTKDAFCPTYEVDKGDGSLKRSPSSKTHTVISRLDSLWSHIREARKEFEASPDTGLLSKSMTRYLHCFVNYFVKGFLTSVAITLLLPIAILVCSSLSIILAITAPLYVWIGSAIGHLLAFLFWDFDGHSKWSAVVWNVLINIIALGVLQPITAVVVAFILCPIGTALGTLVAFMRKGMRDAWDALVFQLVIRKRARIPVGDGFLAKRISGPGLASHYYYQIKTEQALVALETRMELDQLVAFQGELTRQIRKPQDEYKAFVTKTFGPFGVAVTKSDNSPYQKLDTECEALLAKLNDSVKKRSDYLNNTLPSGIRTKIRLTENDLRVVLMQGTLMVQEFYPQKVLAKMTDTDVRNFWLDEDLPENDWLGLTSILLSELFSQEFLTPLQEVDITFALKVKHWNLSRYLNMALEAKWRDDLDLSRVIHAPKLGLFVGQPEIPLESFNPMAYFHPKDVPCSLQREASWRLYQSSHGHIKLTSKLSNPLPLPHPLEIAVIICNRDAATNHPHLDMDQISLKSLLRTIEELPQPLMAEYMATPKHFRMLATTTNTSTSPATPRREDSQSHAASIYEMDPAMASLTQSLEELDRDVEDETPSKRNNGLHKSGPGSIPLLASTEDIAMVVSAQPNVSTSVAAAAAATVKEVNPDSYSTVV